MGLELSHFRILGRYSTLLTRLAILGVLLRSCGVVYSEQKKKRWISASERALPTRKLTTTRCQTFLYVGQHWQNGGLVQLSNCFCFFGRICLKMGLDGHINNVLYCIYNLINMSAFKIVFSFQSKLSS